MNRNTKARIALAIGLLLATAALSVGLLNRRESAVTREIFAMDTVMSFTVYGKSAENALTDAVNEVNRLDALLSTEREESEVARINREGGGAIDSDLHAVLSEALRVYAETDGAFDITLYPLSQLWGFPGHAYRVPTSEEIAAALPLADAGKIVLTEDTVTMGEGQMLDLGGIAKGYTSARVMEILRQRGIRSAIVSLGGNVQTLGRRPDGTLWKIGVRDPENGADFLAVVAVEDKAVITSGGYERYFEADGTRYVHILDPKTGMPVQTDVRCVTVVCADGMRADALSTALFVMGSERAEDFWRVHKDEFDMILQKEDGSLHITAGLRGNIESAHDYMLVQ